MNIEYALLKKNNSKRRPELAPTQTSGIESSMLEITSERYAMRIAGTVLVVKPLKGDQKPFCYPVSDFDYLVPADEPAQGKR